MIYEIIQIIACGFIFGIVLITIDTYLANRKNKNQSLKTRQHDDERT